MESDRHPKKLTYHPETGLCVPIQVMYIIFITAFMDIISTSISNPVMPLYAENFNADPEQIGFMYAATSAAAFFGTGLLAKLSDAWGRRPVILLACLGTGLSGVAQASAQSFEALFAFRAFGGIWTAIQSVAQVYISDISSPEALPGYMSKLAAVPNFSRTMGPGLGGGLSEFGVNIPILVDGLINLVLACLVCYYVPESPAFAAKRKTSEESPKGGWSLRSLPDFRRQLSGEKVPVPWTAYGIGVAQFFNGIQIGLTVSMLAISLKDKFKWDALDIGYTGVLTALITLATTIGLAPRFMRRVGGKNTACLGTAVIACGLAVMGSTRSVAGFLIGNSIRAAGMGFRQGSMGVVQARITHISNRGAVFGRIQMFNQAGQFVGPIIGGYLADIDPLRLLWWFPAVTTLFSGVLLFFVPVQETPEARRKTLLEDMRNTIGDGPLQDEHGSPADYEDLAKLVGGLLTRGHYRWVSQRGAVYAMLEKLLPELSTDGKGHMQDLQLLWEHADAVHAAFEHNC